MQPKSKSLLLLLGTVALALLSCKALTFAPNRENHPNAEQPMQNTINGKWKGITSQNHAINFTVNNNFVAFIYYEASLADAMCREFYWGSSPEMELPVLDNSFTFKNYDYDPSQEVYTTISGTFASNTTASGVFILKVTGDCHGEYELDWKATKEIDSY
ncbi:MAG: hypothetical protein QM730_30515 [Anaerolineales bacterium]